MLLFPVRMMASNPNRIGFVCLVNLVAKHTLIHLETTQLVTVTSVISGTKEPVDIFPKMDNLILQPQEK